MTQVKSSAGVAVRANSALSALTVIQMQLALLVLSLSLYGISLWLGAGSATLHLQTFGLEDVVTEQVASRTAASVLMVTAVLALWSLWQPRALMALAYLLLLIGSLGIAPLFTGAAYIDALGGFPAIGAGQGVVKYSALILLAIGWLLPLANQRQRLLLWLLPSALVLLWIGGMKFTGLEAAGIEPLLQSSPLLSWLLWLDLQTASNLIGAYDLVAVSLLISGLWRPTLGLIGVAMAMAVMLTTQTFLLSWPDALSATTVLTGGGQFVIKDLWYVATLLMAALVLLQSKHECSLVETG